MRKRLGIPGAILVAAILGLLAWQAWCPREKEPVFLGKDFSGWFVPNSANHSSADLEAMRQMGTNALPFLIRELRSQDGFFWRKLPVSAYKLRIIRWLSVRRAPPAATRHERAAFFLKILGPTATPVIPALSDCLDRPDIAVEAVEILGYFDSFGHPSFGPEAVLPLLKATTNSNLQVRRIAANSLGLMKTRPDLAVPALIHALKDPSAEVRAMAARSFGGYKAEAATIVPALMDVLGDTDSSVRRGAAWMLGMYRVSASAAVPKLLPLLNDPTPEVRKAATDALKLIDPEPGAKAE